MDDFENLRPLKPGEKIKTNRGPHKGKYSTERVRTVQNPDGTWMNVNSLWMGRDGTVTDLANKSDDWLASYARFHETSAGVKFDRYDSLNQAVAAAKARSAAGGAGSGKPLARPVTVKDLK